MESRIFGALLLTGLTILLGIAVYHFLPVFVGALIIFTIFFPLYKRLNKVMGKGKAAMSVLGMSVLIILIPFLILASLIIGQVGDLIDNREEIRETVEQLVSLVDGQFPQFSIPDRITGIVENAGSFISQGIGSTLSAATNLIINVFLMYVILYFMFVDQPKWKRWLHEILPFSDKNEEKLMQEFANITYSTIVGSGVIAIVQATLVGVSFWITGIPNPFLWAFVSAVLSFLPIIGTPVVWIPAGIYLIITGDLVFGIIFLIFHGVITTNIDNVLRPIVGKKVGNVHPLTSFLGIFFGLYLFGISGLILGPLLISSYFLIIEIYKEEFASGHRKRA